MRRFSRAQSTRTLRAPSSSFCSERGQRIAIDRGFFPIEVISVCDDALAPKRYEQVNATFRREIETVAEALKKKY
jgi:hypothetical protein